MNVPFNTITSRIGQLTVKFRGVLVFYVGLAIYLVMLLVVYQCIFPRPTLTHFLRNGACAGTPLFRKTPTVFAYVDQFLMAGAKWLR